MRAEAMEALAQVAFEGLPAEVQAACGDVVIRIAEMADGETLASVGLDSPWQLLGLFQGVGRAQRGEAMSGELPNLIWLYRLPILDYAAREGERLEAVVRHVLVHEIGHHMGLSDEDMERIEREAAAESP